MDDLSKKIDALLHSPDGMAKIQAAMAAFGGGADDTDRDDANADQADLSQLLAGLGGMDGLSELAGSLFSKDTDGDKVDPAPSSSGMPDLSRLLPLLPVLSGLNKEDDNTALLRALRPHLHGEREKRVDDAIQMMKLMKLMPLISSAIPGFGKER